MAGKTLVIVESPTKARTIRKFLPKGYMVEASMGHIRDLPRSAAEIPAKYKAESWSRLGVDVENDFKALYVVPKGKSKIIRELKAKLKEADALYLATDEDREGESISHHLIELLKPKVPVYRMVFHEITKRAIHEALENCREVNNRLVSSQETRRILDRLVGYTLSPLIWKKIAYGLSAGRVQSAGLRLLVQRERERLAFVPATYRDLAVTLEAEKKPFDARLIRLAGKRPASGKDFDPKTGKLSKPDAVFVLKEDKAKDLIAKAEAAAWKVSEVDTKDITSRPSPPFITSTLQQEANRKLGYSARRTMSLAQRLYERGLITYMRTDSPVLSQQAIAAARGLIEKLYGKDYVPAQPRKYASKSKGAQEAHEAIRPAGETFTVPAEIDADEDERKLYELIYKRAMASQMADAQKHQVSLRFEVDDALYSATGTTIKFPGYLRVYVEGKDDYDAGADNDETILPPLKKGDQVDYVSAKHTEHVTKPIARFTEASIVQRLEKEGIGRPSTYASIISTILERNYATKLGNALVPTFTGFAVVQLLEEHFSDLVDYKFTSLMEEALDEIADGKRDWLPYLKEFYLGKKGLRKQVEDKEGTIDAKKSRALAQFSTEDVEIRVGRFGPYLIREKTKTEDEVRASIPQDIPPADLTHEKVNELIEAAKRGPEPLGKDPKTGLPIYLLLGRYGPYLQVGEMVEGEEKPRRAGIPPEYNANDLTYEQALKALSLPYEVGKHPESGEPVLVNRGRFGPYVQHGTDYRSLKKEDDVYNVTFERAMELLSQEKKSRRGPKMLHDLGAHPKKKTKVRVYDGKYGPYIKMGTRNFSIPKDEDIEKMTLARAVELIEGSDR